MNDHVAPLVPVTFPPNPTVGEEYLAQNNIVYRWDGVVWVARTAEYPDPGLYQGTWQVAANVPDLTANAILNEDGWIWLAQTADYLFGETADAAIPGIGSEVIWNGWIIQWVAATQQYIAINTMTLNIDDANNIASNYVLKVGDEVTGTLIWPTTTANFGHALEITDGSIQFYGTQGNSGINITDAGAFIGPWFVSRPSATAGYNGGFAFGTIANQDGGLYNSNGLIIRQNQTDTVLRAELNDGSQSWNIIDQRAGTVFGEFLFQVPAGVVGFGLSWSDTNNNFIAAIYNGSTGNIIFRTENNGDAQTAMTIRQGSPGVLANLQLAADPVQLMDAATKNYVDSTLATIVAFQGTWEVAANNPDLDPAVVNPVGGWYWIASTVDPNTPEMALATLPGIGGEMISNGDMIIWSGADGEYHHLVGNTGLTKAEADTYYVQLGGSQMTGPLFLSEEPQSDTQAATKFYVDNQTPDVDRTYVDAQDALRVLKSGDTMTGQLTVEAPILITDPNFGNPGLSLLGGNADIIQFIDVQGVAPRWALSYNIIGGGGPVGFNITRLTSDGQNIQDRPFAIDNNSVITVSNCIILPNAPVNPTDAVNKAYVDQLFSGQGILLGVINATTGICQFTDGTSGPVPDANSLPDGDYLICVVPGTIPPGPAGGISMNVGDWIITSSGIWFLVPIGSNVIVTADQVGVIPQVFGSDNVQAALEVSETRAIPAGGPIGFILGKNSANDYDIGWQDPGSAFDTTNTFLNRTPAGSTSGDLNNQTTIGAWNYSQPIINGPPFGTNGGNAATNQLIVHNFRSGIYIIQEVYEVPGPLVTNPLTIYTKWMRSRDTNFGWTAWIQQSISNTDGAFLPLTGGQLSGTLRISTSVMPEIDLISGGASEIRWFAQNGGSWVWHYDGNSGPFRLQFTSGGVPTMSEWITVTPNVGTTLNGNVSSAAAPTTNNHLTNKAYVDIGDADLRAYVDNLVSSATICIGSINAATGDCTYINGTSGPVIPANRAGEYLICTNAGTIPSGPAQGTIMIRGDWLYDNGTVWFRVAVGSTGVATSADQVALIPAVFGANNVQAGFNTLATGSFIMASASPLLRLQNDTGTGRITFRFGAADGGRFDIYRNSGDSGLYFCYGSPTNVETNCFDITKAGNIHIHPPKYITWGAPSDSQPPSVGTRSPGTKIVFWDGLGAATLDYAIGMQGSSLWFSCRNNGDAFRWYFGSVGQRFIMDQNYFTLPTAPTANMHAANKQYVDARVIKAGDQMTGTLTFNQNSNAVGIDLYKNNRDANTNCPSIRFRNSKSNSVLGEIRHRQDAQWYAYQDYSHMEFWCGSGIIQKTFQGQGGRLTVYGPCDATQFNNTSDIALKMDIASISDFDVNRAFAALIPKRFRWKPQIIDNPLAAPHGKSELAHPDPERLNWGFVAQDIEKGDTNLVHTRKEYGKDDVKSYDLAGIVAVMAAKIAQLEARLNGMGQR